MQRAVKFKENTEKRIGEEEDSFNINKMLEQITSKVKKDDAMDGLFSLMNLQKTYPYIWQTTN